MIVKLQQLTVIILILAVTALTGFWAGYDAGSKDTAQTFEKYAENQRAGETARLQYAWDAIDSCSSDQCLQAWSELIEGVQAK